MLFFYFKTSEKFNQLAGVDEAIRTDQFVRNS